MHDAFVVFYVTKNLRVVGPPDGLAKLQQLLMTEIAKLIQIELDKHGYKLFSGNTLTTTKEDP